jgi:glycerophosphoryl diester phosphodiesterase
LNSGMTAPAFGVLGGALADLRRSFRALVLTDLVYKAIAIAALSPLTLLLLRWALSRSGAQVVTDVEIATFFLTSGPGLLALVLGSALVAAITAVELSCVMAVAQAAAHGRAMTVRAALAFGAGRAVPVLRLTLNMVVRLILAVLPFALAIGLVYVALLRDHDINFYLARRPPEFLIAAGLAAIALAGLLVVLVRIAGRWALALPLVLFEDISPRRALAESSRRASGHFRPIVPALLLWVAVAATLASVAGAAPEALGRAIAPSLATSLESLLAVITLLLFVWGLLVVLASVVNAVLFALVILRLYRRVNAAEGRAEPAIDPGDSAGPVRLPAALRGAIVATMLLGAAGVALAVTRTTRQNQPVVVIAHRGASADAPENTLAAFRLAADEGADFIELDVQESSDGEVVVIHDADLMKVGGSPLKIWASTAADLRTVDIGSHKAPQFSAERVPTLRESLDAVKGRSRVIVELKTYGHGQRLEERVADIVEAAGVAGETVFMSLDHGMAARMKALRPDWRVGILVAKALGDLTTIKTDFVAVQAGMATRSFVRDAHRAGLQVYAWTVNDPVLMVALMSLGVDGLITDKPALARQVVERRRALTDEQRIAVALLVRLGVSAEALKAAASQ